MIVIYSQEKTFMYESASRAEAHLLLLYGEKLGREACDAVNGAEEGTSYQKFGGPLVQVVSEEKAEAIFKKEREIGMME